MKESISFILYELFYPFMKKKMSLLSLYFHNPTPTDFEKIIIWGLKHKYRFIDLVEFVSIIKKDKPLKGKCIFISFDDGWRGNLKLIPIIEKYKVPITLFVATEPLISGNYWWEYAAHETGYNKLQEYKELPYELFLQKVNELKKYIPLLRSSMTCQELALLSKNSLVSIQSHTVTHPILTVLPEELLNKELLDSKIELEKETKKSVIAFSYPNGSLTERETNACKKHYKCAFTTEQRNPAIGDDLYLLPRIALASGYWSNLAKITGIWWKMKQLLLK